MRALVPSCTDLLPPRKRFRESISLVMTWVDASIDMEVDVEDEVEDKVESSDRGTMEVGVDVVVRIDIPVEMRTPDVVKRLEQIEEGLQDIYEHVIEIPLQRIEDIKTGQRELKARSLIAGAERASLLDQVVSLERSNMSLRGTMMMERARADRFQRRMSFMKSELRQIHSDGDNENSKNGNGGDGNGGNGNPNEDNRGSRLVARECTYQDFMKCQPVNFKGTEGVVGLIRWFEKMEIVFLINNYPETYQEKTKIQKMESKLWNLTVKNNDLAAYTQRFQERTMMCTKMVPEEEDRVEKFIGARRTTMVINLLNKRQNVGGQNIARAYRAGNNKRRVYNGPLPLYNKCKFHREGVDRSFMSTTFSTLLDMIPDTLDVSYLVELADGRIYETNTVLRGCTLGFLGHPFNIDLILVELGSFDVIISGMDWLANHHAVIACDEKIMQIPYGDEVLIVQGDRSDKGKKSMFSIISCTET
nr:reverse transcriptase domain-containing protein [Tanacetum cinerariifolium]